jgi:hypothetical protein
MEVVGIGDAKMIDLCACGKPKQSSSHELCRSCYCRQWRQRNRAYLRQYKAELQQRHKLRVNRQDDETRVWAMRRTVIRSIIDSVHRIAPDFTDEQIASALLWYVAERKFCGRTA